MSSTTQDITTAPTTAAACAMSEADVAERPRRRPALSPSRAADFKQCPLLYRFRAVDRLPEKASTAQVRGTVVHAALEQMFALPAAQRTVQTATALLEPSWRTELQQRPELAELFVDTSFEDFLRSAEELVESYFQLEDPTRFEPQSCELLVEAELDSGVLLRGYVDRIDQAPTGELRVVDYKTGAAPRAVFEAKAMFQMKFYALALYRLRAVVPRQLKLMYLRDTQHLLYSPDEPELLRFERTLEAIWRAILAAAKTGDFRPSPSKLCNWCDHKALCPAFGGTPPEYPGWPDDPTSGAETVHD